MKILSQVSLFHAKPGEIIPPVWPNYWWLGLAALLVSVLIDFLIIRRVWHAVKKPVATNATLPILKPDRFWRWFAVTVLALISIPIVIAILGLLAAVAIPNFVRARQLSQQNAARQWTQEGWQLWQAQKLDQAAAKFRQAVQLVPNNADAWNGLGWATFNAGESQEAEQAFQKALSLDTNQPGALNGLGQIYLSQRKYDQAETYLLRAAPQAPAAWHGLTRLYLLEGKFDQAESWAQKLVDSGQADDFVRQMLKAAEEKHLNEGLRVKIEPPQPAKEIGNSSVGSTSSNSVSAPDSQPQTRDAVSAAQKWLALIDGGNYSETWNEASAIFRGAVTEPGWENSMNTFRQPLGNLISRKLRSAQLMTELPGVPDGRYVVMQFETSFAGKKSTIETVTFMLGKDGQWKSAGYFIK
jgi:tetratricopeptide (TPR) repeat protein